MNYWVIADTHFGHAKMQEYCGRPAGFEDKLLHNLMMTCKLGDVLIHLGDVCLGRDEYWHRELENMHARKWLIRGNHDKKSASWYLAHGWDCVGDVLVVNVFGKRIAFSHRPVVGDYFDICVHGHLHNGLHHPEYNALDTDRYRLVAVEHGYAPVNLRALIEKRGKQNDRIS